MSIKWSDNSHLYLRSDSSYCVMDTDDGQHLELLHAGSSDVSLLCISEGVIVSILLAIAPMR